jgi:transcription-repair coupling factor (superfamily II helicase)
MSELSFLPTKIDTKQTFGQLQGCSLSLALALFSQNTAGVKLVVAPTPLRAIQLQQELQFFLQDQVEPHDICLFPDWETLPYDYFSPHQDIISERLAILNRLVHQPANLIVIASVSTLMHKICPREFITQQTLLFTVGQPLSLTHFREQLIAAGYRAVNQVLEHGEFALRGGIIDIYPMGSAWPYRIECFDECIDSLRRFDPDNQRSIAKVERIQVLPAREFPINAAGIAQFRQNFREQFPGNPGRCMLYNAVTEGQFPNGIEYYLPLFFENTASFFDYLPTSATICLVDATRRQAEQFEQDIAGRFAQREHDVTRPILKPSQCFLSAQELLTAINHYHTLRLQEDPARPKGAYFNFNTRASQPLPLERQATIPFHRLQHYLQHTPNRCVIMVESAGRREVLNELLQQSQLHAKIQPSWAAFCNDSAPLSLLVGPLSTGVELIELKLTILVESQFFGEQRAPQQRRTQKAPNPDLIIRDLAELQLGAPVVHLNFGVGRYQGLQSFATDDVEQEYLVLHYAGDDKIYVPVTALHYISRYTGADSDHAPLHRLGTDQWQKEKQQAAKKITDTAVELLAHYAQRAAVKGYAYQFDHTAYQRFASSFPFDETVDQQRAIQDIIHDMQADKPMDRLICGDVGFGKTEVAMRAAFIAVENGKQVCVLVPTTLLAGQHFQTFKDRFAEFPIQIELLSRFRSAKETTTVLNSLASGHTDIVIGTHKLFQKDLQFKQLGLLIIDEEHRFGVKQKEHINAIRAQIDILSMTATPIPRTLNMAMAGIRDISLITTPPAKRLAIKTFWQERRTDTLREAILREIMRGGQVFFLHNNVQTIAAIQHELQQLVPEAVIQTAHGQLRERDLERIMSDFYHHRFNVLVCTTIIETGIDIPTANTIIIDRADQFGLAQLHQLRGRVGRSHHQAYAYLLTPPDQQLTSDAKKRLNAIISLEDLGAGFTLATHDLEIRGAGDLLGEEQSGNMHAIGFHLFMEMLERAVNDLKAGRLPDLTNPIKYGPDITIPASAIIPEDYIGDVHTRLIMYKRIANATDESQLHTLQVELIDRFGLLPDALKRLIIITQLKQFAAVLGVVQISVTANSATIEFNDTPAINPGTLIKLIQVHSKRYQMRGPNRLIVQLDATVVEQQLDEIKQLLQQISIK